MKRALISVMLVLLGLTAGCARHYVIRLNNGVQVTTTSKPKLKNGTYYFKDARGKTQAIAAGRVSEVAPASMAREEKSPFKPETR